MARRILGLAAQDAAVAGIDVQFHQSAIAAQEFDFVAPAAVFAFQFDFHDLSWMLSLDASQQCLQGQDFLRFQRLPGAVMVLPGSDR
jgi:hypothetical protein